MNRKEIYVAGGCYWGTEHFFKQVQGVLETEVGFANGNCENPTYEQVCKKDTGFAETVRIAYDADKAPLDFLIKLYFMIIDPTSINKQGEDEGDQYRTGLYYIDEADKAVIEKEIAQLQKKYDKPIAIEVQPMRVFFPAKEEHQDYLDKNPNGYCHVNISMFKIAKEATPAMFNK